MKTLFTYNWQVRDEWLQAFESISEVELLRDRKAGVGSILKTLFHIIDVEYSWIRAIKNEPDLALQYHEHNNLKYIRNLSDKLRLENKELIDHWSTHMEFEVVKPSWMDKSFYKGEILRHIVVHEIHHVGQLSIWSKELGIQAVSSNFIGREFMGR
ncbi:Uncharacterized damage-inducible protein DinB (forms a four-helix bundle) [Paenibacillus sp. 1_12]|uniref:DinB family protein n=1 Tax=Paenibacillus sp. 1_12 TaxID=1566278 RepID=UPI0008E1451E|nr:DinB family protein [Paenibacillus sp. 1_12]SFM18468.1 Uncharacterized damage-inducible protein DinB (forms a four-helix bundle) [Paenibacillus sp. 1_12]